MKLRGAFPLLLVANLWMVDANLRITRQLKKKRHKEEFGLGENGYDVVVEEPDVDTVEVIIGLNIPDEGSTFTTMSNTIDLLSDFVTLEHILPQIKSGVAKIPADVRTYNNRIRFSPRVVAPM